VGCVEVWVGWVWVGWGAGGWCGVVWCVGLPGCPSPRIPGVRGDPLRKFTRQPLDQAPARRRIQEGPSGKQLGKPKCGRRLATVATCWACHAIFPRGSSRFVSQGLVPRRRGTGGISGGCPPGPRETVKKEARGLGTLEKGQPSSNRSFSHMSRQKQHPLMS
jgi:hypothetical protein